MLHANGQTGAPVPESNAGALRNGGEAASCADETGRADSSYLQRLLSAPPCIHTAILTRDGTQLFTGMQGFLPGLQLACAQMHLSSVGNIHAVCILPRVAGDK